MAENSCDTSTSRSARSYRRFATEEAWASRELIKLYSRLLETHSSDDPGFNAMWAHFIGGRSTRVVEILDRLLDVGDRRIGDMDDAGIDKQLLLLTSPGVQVFEAATLSRSPPTVMTRSLRSCVVTLSGSPPWLRLRLRIRLLLRRRWNGPSPGSGLKAP
jgi:hypothetical protein